MYTVGIDLGGTNIAAGICLDGKIIKKISVKTHAERPFCQIADDMISCVTSLVSSCKLELSDISSVGLGVPGTVDSINGVIKYSNNIKITDFPIVEYISSRLSLPVFADNDANCAAFGEVCMGSATGLCNVVMLTLGTGVGSGIIINGKIYGGTEGAGAEIGHNALVVGGDICTCGRAGCAEALVSATGLVRKTREAIEAHPESIMKDAVKIDARLAFNAARAGDKAAADVVKDYITNLGELCVDISNIFRPEAIIIGGGVSNEGEYLFKPLNDYVKAGTFGAGYSFIPPVIKAALGGDAGIVGAAFLYKNEKAAVKVPLMSHPVYKDYLWGGNALKTRLFKDTPYDVTAESWELSDNSNGKSTFDGGLTLSGLYSRDNTVFGSDCSEFPILIKLIDAARDLSVQVHPDDEYAVSHGDKCGKTEMWCVLDAADGAGIYLGFSKDVTKEDVTDAIARGSLTDLLNFVPLSEGDSVLIPAGTVHAIGAGLLIAEIQQNCDITYRVYDYGRVGADGKTRPLHIAQALDVAKLSALKPVVNRCESVFTRDGYIEAAVQACKYFSVSSITVSTCYNDYASPLSFVALLAVKGEGSVVCGGKSLGFKAGQCIFIPAGAGKYGVCGSVGFLRIVR